MPNLNDINNEFIREEIDQFVDQPKEKSHMIGIFSTVNTELLRIAAAVIDGDDESVDTLTKQQLDKGIEATEIMDDALIAGMGIVGIKFRDNVIFVPEVLSCARAMKAGMAHIEPILSASGIASLGKVVMGTVKGDLHDIG